MSNLTKVWLFLISTSFATLIIGYSLAERKGLFFAFLLNITFIVIIYLYGDRHLLRKLGAKKLVGQDPWGVSQILAKYASLLSLPHPHLYIIESESMYAFSTGLSQEKSSIVLTTGLINKLELKEVQSVIAHEIAQIQTNNTFAFSILSTLANTLTGVSQFIENRLPFQMNLTKWFSPLSWLLIKSTIRHESYYYNDSKAAQLTQSHDLASALWKINSSNQVVELKIPPCINHLFVINPEKNKNIFNNFHPPVDSRIKKLIGYYPP